MNSTLKIQEIILASVEGTLKEADGLLKHPYISPGGPYATTLWDWDSYWTLFAFLGIAKKLNRKDLIDKIAPYARGVVFNFLEHQGDDGSLPILITPEDDDLFDCKKSADNNMAKPFIAQTALLLVRNNLLKTDDLTERIYQIRAFHQCYEERYTNRETGLLFWAKDWGIGVDDDPACWGRPEKSCASIFLNTFFYRELLAAAELSNLVGRPDYADEYRGKAEKLAAAIQKYCWDEREKAFFSADIQCRQNLTPHRQWGMLNFKLDAFWHVIKLKILSWNCILPLWAGIGTQKQIDDFIKENLVEGRLLSDYGIRSLSADEPMYAPEVARGNPSNWLGPIWILVNYITWEMLNSHGHGKLADQVATRTLNLLDDDLKKTGVLHEYYSPETGKPICSPGFVSWNALAGLFI